MSNENEVLIAVRVPEGFEVSGVIIESADDARSVKPRILDQPARSGRCGA